MRLKRRYRILFLSTGFVFFMASILSLHPLLPFGNPFAEYEAFVFCEGWGCLRYAEYEVERMKGGKLTGQKIALCAFHRPKTHDPLYVPYPWQPGDSISMAVLLLFTSGLFLFPGLRTGIREQPPGERT